MPIPPPGPPFTPPPPSFSSSGRGHNPGHINLPMPSKPPPPDPDPTPEIDPDPKPEPEPEPGLALGPTVDPRLWHACAGPQVRLPRPGSRVIYFPQGHAEHTASSASFDLVLPAFLCSNATIPCRVLSVKHLADPETDEVFARIQLQPEDPNPNSYPNPNPNPNNLNQNPDPNPNPNPNPNASPIRNSSPNQNDYLNQNPSPGFNWDDSTSASRSSSTPTTVAGSFAKTLTQSDANNGGGFSVPRYCAETIFPRLDYRDDPPVQIVLARDVHGRVWKFRHIYRGTPRRHLLTTGWSSFVNQKKLVAGDAVVFLRGSCGAELCIGIRRSSSSSSTSSSSRAATSSSSSSTSSINWLRSMVRPFCNAGPIESPARGGRFHIGDAPGIGIGSAARATNSHGFLHSPHDSDHRMPSGGRALLPWSHRARHVTPKSIVDSVALASSGKAFEIVYYPVASADEFCVDVRSVQAALRHSWSPGMRFKMAVETEDASRISWFMGTVSKVQDADPLVWPNSPWKILQVTWDEPDLLQGMSRVSPWQVELVPPIQLPPFSFPKKKVRLSRPSDTLALDGGGMGGGSAAAADDMPWHMMNSLYGYVDTTVVVPPARMQGARHEVPDYRVPLQSPKFHSSPTGHGFFLNNFYRPLGQSSVSASVSTDLFKHQFAVCPSAIPGAHHNKTEFSGHSSVIAVPNHHHHHHHHYTHTHPHPSAPASVPKHHSGFGSFEHNGRSPPISIVNPPVSISHPPALVNKKTTTSFLLFGTTIDTSPPPPSLSDFPPQPENSSDSVKHESAVSDSNKSEVYDTNTNTNTNNTNTNTNNTNNNNNVHNFFPLPVKSEDEPRSTNPCKVFTGCDDVGRIIDLSRFESYEDLYKRLEKMFGAKKHEFLNRVVYVDFMGFSRLIGDEPYRDFTRNVKQLKIL